MSHCVLEQRGRAWYCINCAGLPLKGNYKRQCKIHGVGYHLKRLLARILLLGRAGCGCDVHAAEMDRNAPDWCEANIDTIVGWMRAEAKKRKLPFSVRGARLLVRVAIRNARREEARESKALSLTTPPRLEKRENPKSFLWGPPPD